MAWHGNKNIRPQVRDFYHPPITRRFTGAALEEGAASFEADEQPRLKRGLATQLPEGVHYVIPAEDESDLEDLSLADAEFIEHGQRMPSGSSISSPALSVNLPQYIVPENPQDHYLSEPAVVKDLGADILPPAQRGMKLTSPPRKYGSRRRIH